MLLKSLELQGFKTFPDKTKLTFDKGITSVVGPNGSGKSNVSDAIRWVLGEQSPKTLRCSKMEDVVFNGTDSRKRQGYAEVTLTIDNSDRFLPYNGDDVSVTRRYYRSGESEYLINKASVRLKDIHELFMDTGLGRDGYSIIGQGKIDSIVSSKSEDRREIFEEAAGISRYRYRKSEAERKLLHTQDNLVRLKDIVTELELRVGPLKIQSEKAQKFLEYSSQKRSLEIALWLDMLEKSSAVLKDHEDKIAVAKMQYEEAEKALNEISSRTEEIYMENIKLSSEIDDVRKCIDEYESDISEKRSLVSVAQNDILHNNENINRLNLDVEKSKTSSDNLKANISNKENKITELNDEITTFQKSYNDIADKLNNINTDASRNNDELQKLTTKVSLLSQQSADMRVTDITSGSTIEDLENRISVLDETQKAKAAQLSDLADMKNDYQNKLEEVQKKAQMLNNSIEGVEMKLKSRIQKRDELKQEADNLRLDAEEKSRRAKILTDLAQNYEGFYNSVKAVMKEAKKGGLGGICGPVSQLIKVPDQYNIAIEVALSSKMQNIVVETDSDAKRAISFLKSQNAGRATFLPITTIKKRTLEEKGLDDCYGFIGVADKLCSCEEKYNAILSSLLGRIVVADDINSASAIAKKYSYRFTIVTLDGQVINPGGSFTGGSLAKKSGLLSRQTEIDKFTKLAAQLSQRAQAAFDEFKKIEKTCSECDAVLLASRADLSACAQENVKLNAEYNACLNEYKNLNSSLKEIETEILNSRSKIEESKVEQKKAKKVLEQYSAEIYDAQEKIKLLTGNKDEMSKKREEFAEKLQEIRLQIVTKQKDIDTLQSEINLAKESGNDQKNHIEELNREIENIKKNNSDIENKIVEYNELISDLSQKIAQANKKIEEINHTKNELEKQTVELRQKEREKNSERELTSNEYSRLEERKLNLQKQFDDINSKLWEEYELTRNEAQSQAAEIENITSAKSTLSQLKQKIKALGSVNVSAIEEYKEVSERYDFMKVQVDDVESSKKEIENLISNLTKQMKEVFVESFSMINKNFSDTFKELFGGGNASLELSDPDNILTSGIEINVNLPGKIVLRLEALSGGEKALVAIALYFAIMKVRPAPFCVMDEIEAALDEVNVTRFAQYLKNLTNNTQFILITHRRGTMEEADVLYGVTMQDEGVSKLLELRTSEVASKLGINAR